MSWYVSAWDSLLQAAAGGLIVLALGGLAVRLCRQPVRRSRLVVLTIVGALLAPWISVMGLPIPFRLPVAPWWASGVPTPLERGATQGPTSVSIAMPARTDQGPRPLASEPVGWPVYPNQANAKRTDPRTGRWTSTTLSSLSALPWKRIVLVAYASTSTGLLAWWVLGQAVLWRLTRAAWPVSRAVRRQFLAISGPAGSRVRLLESDRIALPFTFTWTCPVILVPSALCARGDEEALNYALAHEWSHIEHRDAWAWNLTALAGLVLFYQPLYWWLRRQLRLCQDYLADDRAAAIGSPEDYAACLVRIARLRVGPSGAALPAMGIYDQPSNLSRRVDMLIEDREPIEQYCPRSWTFAAAATTALAILFVSGLRADSTPAPDESKRQAPKAEPREVKAEPKGETLHYSGKVRERDNGKPIAGATVVVRRSCPDPTNGGNRIIAETRHTTNAEGGYSFTIPPEQVAEKRLYIELDVEHPDYATQARFGYQLALIRKDEARGVRPFFEYIRLRPAKPILGRVESPDGKPIEGVEIVAYSLTHKVQTGPRENASFTRVRTDLNGRFRVPVTTPGLGVFWIVPKDYAPEMHAIPEGQRGELGTFHLKKGLSMKGRAFDTQGKPLAGLLVKIQHDRDSSPDNEFLDELGVSDMIERSAETDPAGRFTFDPLPAGVYMVQPVADQDVPGKGRIRRRLPGVFAPQKVTLRQGETPDPLEIRMSPHVVIEGGWIDSKGKPRGGSQLMISGYVDGQSWHTMIRSSAEGKFSVQVPHGIERAQVHLSLGSFASTRYRIGKEGKLVAGQYIMFGTLDHDVRDLQIVRYEETGVIVKATAKEGRPIKDVILAGEYTGEIAMARGMIGLKNGTSTEILFERQADGRFRADDITPDREVKITADADGFRPVSRTFKIPEGKIEEVTFVLEAK